MTTEFTPGSPNWVDLGTTDVAAASAFYSAIFGWTIQHLGPEAGDYGMIQSNGKMVAGIGPATDPDRGASWSVYFATEDAEVTVEKVRANGGQVIVAPMDVMDEGRMAVCTDPAGAFFSLWQPKRHRGAELVYLPVSLTWAELMTADSSATRDFYGSVLGLTSREVEAGPGIPYTLFETDGRAVAGSMSFTADAPSTHPYWSVYFAVEDCDETADKAVSLGATELVREDSPAGRFAVLKDPQGGLFSIIRNNPDFSM